MSNALTGRVVAVNTLPLGDVLVADTPAGAGSLTVDDAADFSENGGSLLLNGQIIEYVSADDETGVLVLDGVTSGAALADDRVEVWDADAEALVAETVAQIEVEGTEQGGDPLEAIVDHALIPFLPEGIRDSSFGTVGETVELEWRGDDLYVVNIVGRTPVMDGAMIDPVTLPDTSLPTAPPAASPALTVEGLPSSLLIKTFDDVVPTTRIQYHVSTTAGFTPSGATLAAETRATVFVLNALPDGSALVPDVTYYVRAVAVNTIGTATPSSEVSGKVDPDALLELAVARVVTGFILTGTIQIGQILIDADQGITIPSGDGTVRFPVDGSVSSITAEIITTALTMQGTATVQDLLNIVGVTELADAGVPNPASAPIVGSAWKDLAVDPTAVATSGFGYDTAGGNLLILDAVIGSGVYKLHHVNPTTGALASTLTLPALFYHGITKIGVNYFSVGTYVSTFVPPHKYYSLSVQKFDASGNLVATYNQADMGEFLDSRPPIATGTDGTNVILAYRSGNSVVTRTIGPTGSVISNATYAMPAGTTGLVGIARGSFYFGATRTVIFPATGDAQVFNGTTIQTANAFSTGGSSAGGTYRTDHFETLLATGATVRTHAPVAAARTVVATYSWHDGNATGGLHETLVSPSASSSVPAGKFVTIECAPAPAAGSLGTDDPRLVRVYAGTPSRTLQVTLPEGTRIATLGALVSGAAEPATNTFAGVAGFSPGYLRSEASDGSGKKIRLAGDGSGRLGPYSWTAAGAAIIPAISVYKAGAQSLTANVTSVVVMDTVRNAGTGGMVLNSGTVTAPRAGWYQVNACITWASSVSSARRICFIGKGTTPGTLSTIVHAQTYAWAQDAANITTQSVSAVVYLAAGEVVGVAGNPGVNFGLDVSQTYMNNLSVAWLGG